MAEQPDPWITDLKVWSILYPYEYSDWANVSWYCNLDWQADFIGHDQSEYLGKHHEWVDRSSDTNNEYDEKSLKLDSPGFHNWISDQLHRTVDSGVGYIEWDNQDNVMDRDPNVLKNVFNLTIMAGLKPILKNPTVDNIREYGALKDKNGNIAIAGCVFERGTMSPVEFKNARMGVNPNLQATWVRHGGNINGQDIPYLCRQINEVPGTSVQWGPHEYNGMKVIKYKLLS